MAKKTLAAFLIYAILFTTVFVLLYPFLVDDGRVSGQHIRHEEIIVGRPSKAVHIPNAVEQRQVLGLYEDSRSLSASQRDSPLVAAFEPHPMEEPQQVPELPIVQDCPYIPKPLMKYVPAHHSVPLTNEEKLLAMCRQSKVVSLEDLFTETMVRTLSKIGEGAFADVYGCQGDDWRKLALKILPVGGDMKYNDEEQNSLKSIQPEMVVTLELSLLGDPSRLEDKRFPHYTKNFMQVERAAYCEGKFPEFMLDAWDEYDYRKDSDNDRPDIFGPKQQYIAFLLENSGMQVGSYVYHSFEEALSILRQVTLSLAIAEEALQFEHRDMHRGNVLVKRTKEEFIYFRFNNKDYHIKTYGVQATIVDFTLSRVTQKESHCLSHLDLNNLPWLFKGKGDIQFDVYRSMKNATKSEWHKFTPFTNVLWVNYLTVKTKIKGS
ncbi:Serine/threonine-protein kinase haspin homolog [Geodia barretti]|uniref:non-specific serine/threonine protein kinase n=3 Tax=Geodia barretti TaxID=519541 RepID=A0AA35XEF8_GEOBA|nr:Serine/threonine-protein kinase haspin homolog [Geodia barretti]